MSLTFEPGQELAGRYRVERLIARGGMAAVYAVVHVTLGSPHAVKVLDLSNAEIRGRLLQEGRIQASLSHPGIVAVTDALDLDGQPALVMERVDGPTLAEVLASRRPTLDEALRWFRQIADAVGFAHGRGLVHRDLKPENILMAERADGLHPKIADFGIAKVIGDWMATREGHPTRAGIGLGTPAYMSPEQIESAGTVDHRADVFALGCILYEMTCGRPAFEGDSLMSVLTAAVAGRYPRPTDLMPGLPPGVVAAIDGALKPDAAARIPSCEAMLALLDAVPPRPAKGGVPKKPRVVPPPPPREGGMLLGAVIALFVVALIGTVGLIGALGLAGVGLTVGASALPQVQPVPVGLPGPRPVVPGLPPGMRVPHVQPNAPAQTRVEVHGWRTAEGVKDGVLTYTPAAGNQLVVVEVTLSNLTDQEVDLFFPWSVEDTSGGSWDAELGCAMAIEGSLEPFADLEPSAVVRGELCFDVPRGAGPLRLRFDPGTGSDPAVVFPL